MRLYLSNRASTVLNDKVFGEDSPLVQTDPEMGPFLTRCVSSSDEDLVFPDEDNSDLDYVIYTIFFSNFYSFLVLKIYFTFHY